MDFKLTVNLDNSSFDNPNGDCSLELAHVLYNVVSKIEQLDSAMEVGLHPIHDINGNRIGFFHFV